MSYKTNEELVRKINKQFPKKQKMMKQKIEIMFTDNNSNLWAKVKKVCNDYGKKNKIPMVLGIEWKDEGQ